MNALVRRGVALLTLAFVASAGLRPALAETSSFGPTAPPPELAAPIPSPPPPSTTSPQAPPRPQATKVHRRRTGLVAAGAVIFGLSYGGALVLSALFINCGRCISPDNALDFAIPIIGPAAGGPSHDSDLMIAWGAAQLGGALMLIYGLKGEDVDVVHEAPAPRVTRRGPDLHLAPLLARDAGGMVLTGRW
jgi:hypothetical protein